MISTRDFSQLPTIPRLKELCQSLALLDAILSPEWESRYYSFNSQWSEGEMMASMRDGSGDEWFLLFTSAGAILKGFAHEASMTPYRVDPPMFWPGVLDNVPQTFAAFLKEPAFLLEDTTFCLWRENVGPQWQTGNIVFPPEEDPDGSADLLAILDGKPDTYCAWAEEYYEVDVDASCVRHIYRHHPLTDEIVTLLNPEMSLAALADDLAEISYG